MAVQNEIVCFFIKQKQARQYQFVPLVWIVITALVRIAVKYEYLKKKSSSEVLTSLLEMMLQCNIR